MPSEDIAAETAASVREDAAQHRARATAARAEAEALLQAATEQAERLVAEARTRAGQLNQDAARADHAAGPLEERATYLHHADQLREQIPDAAQAVTLLVEEADRLAGQIDGLSARLGELGDDRESVGMQLATAAEGGDVDAVTALRTRMAALDEVVAALSRQQQTAEERLLAIGDDESGGEYARATQALAGLRAQLRRAMNWLDPARPEAVQDRLLEELAVAIAGNQERIAEERARNGRGPHREVVLDGVRLDGINRR